MAKFRYRMQNILEIKEKMELAAEDLRFEDAANCKNFLSAKPVMKPD